MMYIENPHCPHCNCELIEMDTYSFEYSVESLVLHKLGECPECGREYQWEQSATCVQWANTNLHLV